MHNKITVALVGNPNSGKTTIFNMLTGLHQHVGNYPGVTVEKVEGNCRYKAHEIVFVDLPGTYSLTGHSPDELVTRNYIIDEQPDVIVDVLDASNIERHLYLTTQLMELEVPLVLSFNMFDMAERQGIVFDNKHLSTLLEAEIIPTVGNKGKGRKELLDAIIEIAEQGKKERKHKIVYGDEIEDELAKLEKLIIQKEAELAGKYIPGWLAIKLLEQDRDVLVKIRNREVLDAAALSVKHLKGIFAEDPEIVIADHRYGFISGACQETIKTTVESRHSRSDMVDAIVTNRVLGLPIFLILMYVVFFLTFKVGSYPMSWLETLFNRTGAQISGFWPSGSDSLIRSLLVDGVIGGVGGVIVFLPNILLLFAAIALLEGTGYMARAAFIMDRIMHKIGLHGKSFIPMLIGFGCSVPAIMATRILENRRNRLTTIMIIPLMSCGARLTIYGLFIPAFFAEQWRGFVLWLMYLIGIILAVIAAKVLRLTLFRGETEPFVMELPPYRMPTIKAIAVHTWQRGWLYLKKAGTIILGISVIMWFAANFPRPESESLKGLSPQAAEQKRLEYSIVGRVGLAIEPAIRPLGFDWKIGTALIGATAAKEVFVSQLGIVYAVGSSQEGSVRSLREKLQDNYTPLTGFCVILFCLIYAPCAATVAITRHETNSWGWAMFQFFGLTALAYLLTLIVYQTGSRLIG